MSNICILFINKLLNKMSLPFTFTNYSPSPKRVYLSNNQIKSDSFGILVTLFKHKLPFTIANSKLELDYLRFIYLKVITQDIDGTIISPTTDIDEIWHTHLLHNKDYLDMCLNINFIVYHYPERANDTEQVKNNRIENFKKIYYQYFKTLPYDVSNNLNNISNISTIAPNNISDNSIHDLYGILNQNNQLNENIPQESDSESEVSEDTENVEYIRIKESKPKKKEYSPPVTIFVKTVTNKNITIEISLDCSIAQLKNLIFFKENIPVETQKLIFAGKRIDYDDKKTLREFNIENHSTIHIMLLLKGC